MDHRRLPVKIIFALLSIVMILQTAAPASAGVVIKGEPDGQTKTTLMDEHFYSGTLEPGFTSDNVSVLTDSFGMHFAGAYHYGSALVLNAYRLGDYNRFTFTVDMLGTNDGFIYCGFGGEDEKTTVSKYDFNLCVASGVTAIYEMGGMDNWRNAGSAPLDGVLAVGSTTDFAVTLEKVSGNNFRIRFEILEEGKAVFSTDYGTTVRMEHPNGTFCMWGGMNEVFDIRDFKVYSAPDSLAFTDSFVNSSITYGDEPTGDAFWHVNEARFTRDEVFIARSAGPVFKNAGDIINATDRLSACDTVSKPYEIAFNTRITELPEGSGLGLYLGADAPGDLDSAFIVCVSPYDAKFASVDLIRNGKKAEGNDDLLPLDALGIGSVPVSFEAEIYSDHTVNVRIGGVRFTFNGVKYDGFWGICSYPANGSGAVSARIDEVRVVGNTYEPCTEPDLSNDFGGIKLTQDGFEEYYISDRTWYLGPGVSLRPKGAFTTEPSLYFENTGSYSSFGPKKPYTDFILSFDVKMVSEGHNSQWFGVNFGKQAFASIPDIYSSIYFEYYAWGVDPCTYMTANLCTFDDGLKTKKIEDYHFYKDQETKYNFMFVAKNRTVYVYFKEDSEDVEKLGICRAVIPDVNTAGFVSIFGVSGLSFDIFNYRLVNIAPEAAGDSYIALREGFDGTGISEKLALDGSAKADGGALRLSGGSLASRDAARYFMADFSALETGKDLTVSFAGDKSLTLSADQTAVTVNDGDRSEVFDVSAFGLPQYKNMVLQLIVQGDSLSLSARGVYEPNDKLAMPIVEYTFDAPVGEGTIKWASDDALIDDVSVYALDGSNDAESVSFEQDPNNTDIWIPKDKVIGRQEAPEEPAQDEQAPQEAAGISPLFIIIYSVIGAVILALLGVIIAMSVKKKQRGQNK